MPKDMPLREFFVWANSNAAPFFSDTSTEFVEAETAELALARARATYGHPAGLYAMQVYESADAFHKRAEPVARWLHPLAALRQGGVPCKTCGKNAKILSENIDGPGLMAFLCEDQHRTVIDGAPLRRQPV